MTGFRINRSGWLAIVVVAAAILLALGMPFFIASWYSWRGDRLQASGNLTAAAAAYRHAVRAMPTTAVLDKLGLVYSKEHLPARAVATLQTAVNMAPADPGTHSRLGIGLLGAGDLPSARQEIRRALLLNPRDPTAHLALSDMNRLEGNIAAADQELETAIEEGVDTPEAHLRMGEVFLARQDPRAEREFEAVERLDPASGAAHLRLGYLLVEKNPGRSAAELQQAADDFTLSLDDRARALGALAVLAYHDNRVDDARSFLTQAADLRPSPAVLAALDFGEGIVRRDSGDVMGSFHAFTAAVAENPHAPAFRTGLLVGGASLYGSALQDYRNGRLAEAEASLTSLISLEPRNPEFAVELARVRTARSDLPGSIRELRRMASISPRDPEIWLELSGDLLQVGRSQQSSDALSRALKLAPLWTRLRPDVDVLLGKIDLASNHPQQAELCFQFAAASHSPAVNAAECLALYQQAGEKVAELETARLTAAQLAAAPALEAHEAGPQLSLMPVHATAAAARPVRQIAAAPGARSQAHADSLKHRPTPPAPSHTAAPARPLPDRPAVDPNGPATAGGRTSAPAPAAPATPTPAQPGGTAPSAAPPPGTAAPTSPSPGPAAPADPSARPAAVGGRA